MVSSDDTILRVLIAAIAVMVVLIVLKKIRGKKMDEATKQLLTQTETIPPELAVFMNLLGNAPVLTDEAACAEQLRAIVSSCSLPYSSLATNPELLLNCSKYVSDKQEMHGALWTRFTVQFNLFAGSIVALGNEEQRQQLYATQSRGILGCFAFTECGAGVLSGACVETTAEYNATTKKFTIHSPTESSKKKWISQGMFAEYAVILANLMVEDPANPAAKKSVGPHLFFARIQNRDNKTGNMTAVKGVTVSSLNTKTALLGLDNAFIEFNEFEVAHDSLLNRFSNIDESSGAYTLALPHGVKRMLDLLISRLLTGRIVLSECTCAYGSVLLRRSWEFASNRELWKGKKAKGQLISELPLMETAFIDYSRSLKMVAHFIEVTRHRVADCIRHDKFTDDVVEAACVSKFVGTSFSVDVSSVLRKLLGSQALYSESFLGASTFVANATCAAEGDNTIMELKIVQDMFRGRTQLFPVALMIRSLSHAPGRKAVSNYLMKVFYAMMIREKALKDGQLLKDIAWCRAHMLILDAWVSKPPSSFTQGSMDKEAWFVSYEDVLVKFPMPIQC